MSQRLSKHGFKKGTEAAHRLGRDHWTCVFKEMGMQGSYAFLVARMACSPDRNQQLEAVCSHFLDKVEHDEPWSTHHPRTYMHHRLVASTAYRPMSQCIYNDLNAAKNRIDKLKTLGDASPSWERAVKVICAKAQAAREAAGKEGHMRSDHKLSRQEQKELMHSILGEHFNRFNGKLQGVIGQLQGAAHALARSADHVGDNAGAAQQQSAQQSLQMDQVATAVNEVTYAVQDVAKTAEQAAGEMHTAQQQVAQGQQAIHGSLAQIDRLSMTIEQAVQVIRDLAGHSTRIGGVLDVIRSIAEQTNLLALNAAIEAARAGEQGRGFAVVADEVRLLAQRTAQSTAEIHTMIEHLQSQSDAAVKAIDTSSEASRQTVTQAREAGASLNAINQALHTLTALNASIASATLQQSHVVEDINRNVLDTAGLSQQAADAARQSSEAGVALGRLSQDLEQLLRQFKV